MIMRIKSIDYLRGLMSLSIVLYHFTTTFISRGIDSSTPLGRLGIYGVSAFYVISGMAMYLAHRSDIWSIGKYLHFIFRRFLRLAPVYWLAIVIYTSFMLYYYGYVNISAWTYVQNIFLTFGVTGPTDYFIMGGWSIGNEVVFYLFLPLFILLCRNTLASIILLSASVGLLFYCSFSYLDPSISLVKQWAEYINPLNQIYFFTCGIVIAKMFLNHAGKNKEISLLMIVVLTIAFCAYPASGDLINVSTNFNKIVFSLITILVCLFFFLIGDIDRIAIISKPLKFLGDISYPLYLLHGVSFLYFNKLYMTKEMPLQGVIAGGVVLLAILFAASWICHISIERPIIGLSKMKLSSLSFAKFKQI